MVVMELCVPSSLLSGFIEILLINCTLPSVDVVEVVVVDDAAPGFAAAGLNVLQLESAQTITIHIGR